MKHRRISILAAAVMLLSLAGCEQKEHYTVTVRNLTGVPISDIYIRPETDLSKNENLLEEHLPTDSDVTLSVGKFTEEEVQQGFALEFQSAEDSTAETFGMLYFDSGDTITVYFDDWGLAVAVNQTDEEIQQAIDSEHEIYVAGDQ